MLCGLYLDSVLVPERTIGLQRRFLIGLFKTHAQALGWYNQFICEPYTEHGPDLEIGGLKTITKVFLKGSPLEWYLPAQSLIHNDQKAETGFFDVPSYEETEIEVDKWRQHQIKLLDLAAQERLDNYRQHIEPKVIIYDPDFRQAVH